MLTAPFSNFDLSSIVKLEVTRDVSHEQGPGKPYLVGRWAGRGVELLSKGTHILARPRKILTRHKGRLDLRDEQDTQIESYITLQLDLPDGVDCVNFVEGSIGKAFSSITTSLKSIAFVSLCPSGMRISH